MAAGFLAHLSRGQSEVRSAGSLPDDQVDPAAVAVTAEVGHRHLSPHTKVAHHRRS